MLTKRTNILFEQELWNKLVKMARSKNISTASLIRNAIQKELTEQETFLKRQKAIESTLKHRLMSKDKIDYKELINYGRKF